MARFETMRFDAGAAKLSEESNWQYIKVKNARAYVGLAGCETFSV